MVLPRMKGEAWPQRPPRSLCRTRSGSGNSPSVMVAFSTCNPGMDTFVDLASGRVLAPAPGFYLDCGQFAEAPVAAPPGGEAGALSTQAF